MPRFNSIVVPPASANSCEGAAAKTSLLLCGLIKSLLEELGYKAPPTKEIDPKMTPEGAHALHATALIHCLRMLFLILITLDSSQRPRHALRHH